MAKITMKHWGATVHGKRGQTILDAALAAGVPYPHGCRSGECGECKSDLCAGEVLMEGYDSRTLTDAERHAGLVLACRAYPRGDVTVSWLGRAAERLHPLRRVTGTVVQVQHPTHDIVRLRIAVDGAPFMFAPGQYAEVTFADCPARPYSMANRPGDPLLEFHVRHVPGGVVGSHVAGEIREGARVKVHGPYGTAFLRKPAGEPMLMVAGGPGLAPIKSILLSALAKFGEDIGPMHLYHGVRESRDLYDGDMVVGAGGGCVHYVPVVTSPSLESVCRHGTAQQAIESDFPSLAGFKVYVAGPPAMVEACAATALRLGAHREDVHADAFHAAPQWPAMQQPAPKRGLLRSLFGRSA